jgi:hypothetical protein
VCFWGGCVLIVSGCVFCGASGVVPVVFLDTFTAYQLLQAGDQACNRCVKMLSDPKFRRNCWYMQGESWFKVPDVLEFLELTLPALDLKASPIVLYLTLQKRKHGWILAVQNPVLNSNRFVLVCDEDKIFFDRERFLVHLQFCRVLRAREIPKVVLLGGYPSASTIRHFGLSFEECSKLRSLQRDKLWELCVKFDRTKPKPEQETL